MILVIVLLISCFACVPNQTCYEISVMRIVKFVVNKHFFATCLIPIINTLPFCPESDLSGPLWKSPQYILCTYHIQGIVFDAKNTSSALYRAAVLNLGTIDMLDGTVLCGRDCPRHCRMFDSIPGLYPLNVGNYTSKPPVVTTKNVSRYCQTAPGG